MHDAQRHRGRCDIVQDRSDYAVTLNNIQGGRQVLTRPEAGATYFGPGRKAMSGMEAMAAMEASQWLDAIINDTEPLVTPEQAVVVTEVMDAIYTSARTGQPVYFNQS